MIRRLIASIRTFAPSHRALAPPCLVVLMAALAVSSAQAVTQPSHGPTSSARAIAADVEEGESEEEEEEEEIEVELEFEEGEEAGGEGTMPAECRLRTARPRLVAHFEHEDTRLTLHYTSYASLRVGVSYWLKGAKGSLQLGSTTRRIGKRGIIALDRHLDERGLAKLRAARTIVVRLTVPHTPGSCRRYLTMRLAPIGPPSSGATWYEPA